MSADPLLRQLDYLAERLADMEQYMVDPKEFGELKGEVSALKVQVYGIASDVKSLLEIANQGKGGLWMFRGMYVVAGGFGAWLLTEFAKFKGWKL